MFARAKAECFKEKAEEKAYDLGVAETQATLKAQFPGVCRPYYSQVWNEALKQVRVEASSNLWKVEHVYYPPAIRENAPSSSEVRDVPKDIEAASPKAVLAITSSKEPAKENKPFGVAEMSEGQNPNAPQKTIESTGDAPVSHAEGPVLLVEPLQAVPFGKGSKDLETSPAYLSKGGVETRPK